MLKVTSALHKNSKLQELQELNYSSGWVSGE